MKEEFVPYELALKLKQLGFDEPCLTYYFSNGDLNDASEEDYTLYPGDPRFYSDTNSSLMQYAEGELKNNAISAPLFQQAFRWFRDEYEMSGDVSIFYGDKIECSWIISGYNIINYSSEDYFNTYEGAELACLKKLIEILESKQEE